MNIEISREKKDHPSKYICVCLRLVFVYVIDYKQQPTIMNKSMGRRNNKPHCQKVWMYSEHFPFMSWVSYVYEGQ